MAPRVWTRLAKLGRRAGSSKRKIAAPARPSCGASVLLLLDVLDHLGHVVLVLAEFGGVLEEFLVLLLGFFERDRLLFLLRRLRPPRSRARYRAPRRRPAPAPSRPAATGGRGATSGTPPGRRACCISGRSPARAANRSSAFRSSDKSAWCPIRVWPPFAPSTVSAKSRVGARIATTAPPCQKQNRRRRFKASRRRAPAYGPMATRPQPHSR